MAMVMRSCEAGYTARKKPASDAPIAGVSLEVRDFVTAGFRRRKASALSARRDARRRVKKRNRSR